MLNASLRETLKVEDFSVSTSEDVSIMQNGAFYIDSHGDTHPPCRWSAGSVHKPAVEDNAQTSLLPVSIWKVIFCAGVPTEASAVYHPPVSLLPRISVIKSRRLSCELSCGILAMGSVITASAQDVRAATARIADTIGAFIFVYFLRRELQGAC
jgi:hypothetical protein